MPNFNFKSQFPISEVIAAAQRKPQMEAEMENQKEAMRQARFKTLLDALSTGGQAARLMSQNKNDALAREKEQSEMAGQQKLRDLLTQPPTAAPVAPPMQQFGAPVPAMGPATAEGAMPPPAQEPTGAVQPTFGDTQQAANQPGQLQAALLQGFPAAAGQAYAEQQFRNPLDDKLKEAQINNVGVDNQIAAARLVEEKRKNDFGIQLDKEKLSLDREKLGVEREKLKLQASEAGLKINDAQANALLFGERAAESNQKLATLIQEGLDPTSLGTTLRKWLPNRFTGETLQQLEQSRLDFVSAVLRKESGAAISAGEWKTASAQYFPADGDSQKTLDQKAKNREIAIGGLLRQGGKQGREIIERYKASAVQPPPSDAAVSSVASEDAALQLAPGTRFRLPDGRTGTVQ